MTTELSDSELEAMSAMQRDEPQCKTCEVLRAINDRLHTQLVTELGAYGSVDGKTVFIDGLGPMPAQLVRLLPEQDVADDRHDIVDRLMAERDRLRAILLGEEVPGE